MAFMGTLGARKSSWFLLADVANRDAEGRNNRTVPVSPGAGPGIDLDLLGNIGAKGLDLNLLGGYTVMKAGDPASLI